MSNIVAQDGDRAWLNHMDVIMADGTTVAPRGLETRELLQRSLVIDLNRPVVTAPLRKLNYRFMLAEALWVHDGDNRLEPLTKHVKRMAEFSDDGVTLFGAYGPPITQQLPYVVQTLANDASSRQAVLTIWRPSPPKTKDPPCTIAMDFLIRENCLQQFVFMRSSDAWLGVPYDMFTFALVGVRVCALVNDLRRRIGADTIGLGALTITAVSAHIYQTNFADVTRTLASCDYHPAVGRIPTNAIVDAIGFGRFVETLRDACEGRSALNSCWPCATFRGSSNAKT